MDTSIFKGHSTRDASSSKAALSGVMVSDILQAAVLTGKASNLHIDIETEPSEMQFTNGSGHAVPACY